MTAFKLLSKGRGGGEELFLGELNYDLAPSSHPPYAAMGTPWHTVLGTPGMVKGGGGGRRGYIDKFFSIIHCLKTSKFVVSTRSQKKIEFFYIETYNFQLLLHCLFHFFIIL